MKSLLYSRTLLTGLIAWMAAANPLWATGVTADSAARPNILFIMADDHASHALSCYGSKINETPNLDCLADGGMRFDNCFCTNSICSPSRAVILTGKYSHLNGQPYLAERGGQYGFDGTQQTVAKLLQTAGYQTAMIGKWHLGLESNPTGFDYWTILPNQGAYHNPTFIEMDGSQRKYPGYVTDIITDKVLEFLSDRRDAKKPFFVMYHHKAPHRPFDPAPEDRTLWENINIPESPTLWDDYSNRASAAKNSWADVGELDQGSLLMAPPAGLAGRELKEWKYQRYIKQYLRTLVSIDRNLGRVLDFLDRSGLADNTVVIYTSDQGFFLGDHGWNDKRFMYEESIRMPLLVRWPKRIQPGSVCDKIVLNLDFAETFLDLAGLPVPADMQGHSLKPLLEGQSPPDWRTAMYYRYYEYEAQNIPRHYGVRTDRYKLIFYHDLNEWELFDLEKDPHELNNVYDDPDYLTLRGELAATLCQLKGQYRDDDTNRGKPLEYGRITSNRDPKRPWLPPDLKVWAPLTLDFRGPVMDQMDDDPNPFLDYRLQVLFTGPSGRQYHVPGYFDGDGEGNPTGDLWRVRFSPDEAGQWHYSASFRQGEDVAVSLDPNAGSPACFDGGAGMFEVRPADSKNGAFYDWGRLEYVGKHYLKFRNGPYWIRGGTDSPEDFLAYAGFDNTPPSHRYADHAEDWGPGDPDWSDGKGRAIIGAVNYLASKQVNSLYFLTMNIGGDGCNVWPWAGTPDPKGNPSNDNLHFDLSKLRQWETVFAHAQRKGIFLHFVLNEAEKANKLELDQGELGTERKLYYRELVARFGHHPAIQWNLCEEYNINFDLGPERVRQFADYLRAVDPYGHPITVHSARDPLDSLQFTFGDPRFSMTSVQLGQARVDTLTEEFRKATAEAGRPLPVSMDEFTVYGGQELPALPVDDAEALRKQKLWPTYLSGGNIEFILEDLLETESFKTPELDRLWDYVWFARRFVEALPFEQMEPADVLLSGEGAIEVAWMDKEPRAPGQRGGPAVTFVEKVYDMGGQVFAKTGFVYAVYLPVANQTGALDLSAYPGDFQLRWYNPRTGEFVGAPRQVAGGAALAIGPPPAEPEQDWAVLLESRKQP